MGNLRASVIGMGLVMMASFEANQEEAKEQIRDEWEKSKNYPRKKKKKARKQLNFRWAFANYDPFTYNL